MTVQEARTKVAEAATNRGAAEERLIVCQQELAIATLLEKHANELLTILGGV